MINIWRMYWNKVKKRESITYTLQLNLTKLNLNRSSSVRRIFQSLVVKTLPSPGCFTACMSAHFAIVKLEYADQMTHRPRHYLGLKCWHVVLIPTSTTAYFDNTLCNKGDEKCNDPSISWDFTVFKGMIFASLNSI